MSSHVAVQVATLGESCITDLTLVRFFSCVCPVVFREGGAIGKALPTHVALVRSVPGVSPHVSRDGAAL